MPRLEIAFCSFSDFKDQILELPRFKGVKVLPFYFDGVNEYYPEEIAERLRDENGDGEVFDVERLEQAIKETSALSENNPLIFLPSTGIAEQVEQRGECLTVFYTIV